MRFKKFLGWFIICAALIVAGCLYFDLRLAEFVSERLGRYFLQPAGATEIPDLLLLLVCATTAASWTGRFYLSKKNTHSWYLGFLEYIGCAVPLAFVLKGILKDLFGRINTRFWLLHPDQYGFHWFHGGGDFSAFPSGHMAVFTVMVLGVSRHFPFLRPVCAGLLLFLALALVVTQYHFFSDIVAGVSVGLLVDLLTCRGLSILPRNRHEFQ